MRIKMLIISAVLFVLLLLMGCTRLIPSSDDKTSHIKQGNTNGNIQEIGYILKDKNWEYISCYGALTKHEYDSRRIIPLNEEPSYNLNIEGKYIYYIEGSPGRVWRIDVDGCNKTKIIDDDVENLIVMGENVFYRLSTEDERWGQVYRTDLDGRNKRLIISKSTRFAINGGFIYYSNGDDGNSLYKSDLEGNKTEKLNNEYTSSINVDSGYVYYTVLLDNDGTDNPYRIRTDGTEKVKLSEYSCWNLNVYNCHIYFRNQSEKGKVYRMDIDGRNMVKLSDIEQCTYINVTEDTVTFNSIFEGIYYRCSLDGDNIEQIQKIDHTRLQAVA
jgi:hypothetical protein